MKFLRMAKILFPAAGALLSLQIFFYSPKAAGPDDRSENTADQNAYQTADQTAPVLTIRQSRRRPSGRSVNGNGRAEEYYNEEVAFTIEFRAAKPDTVTARYELETGKTGHVSFEPKEEEGDERSVWVGEFVLDDEGNDPALRGDVLAGLEIRFRDAGENTPAAAEIINDTNLEFSVIDGTVRTSADSPCIVIDKNAPKVRVILPDPEMSTNSKGNIYYFRNEQNITAYIREANLFVDYTRLCFTTVEDGRRVLHEISPDDTAFFENDGALYTFTAAIGEGTVFGDFKIKRAVDFASNTTAFHDAEKNTYITDTAAPMLNISVTGDGISEFFSNGTVIFAKLNEPASQFSGQMSAAEPAEMTLRVRVSDPNLETDTESGYREGFYVYGMSGKNKWSVSTENKGEEVVFEKTIRIPADSTGCIRFDLHVRDLAGNVPDDFTCEGLLAPVKETIRFGPGRAEGLLVCDRTRPSGNEMADAVPEIILATESQNVGTVGDNTPLYRDSVLYGMTVYDPAWTGPGGEMICSGLREVSWTVISAESCIGTSGNENIFYGETSASLSVPVTISGKGEADDIILTVKVTDLSGNETVYTHFLAIDNKEPHVNISYDNQDCQNGNFYKEGRILMITVDDLNFDPERTKLAANADFSGWTREGKTYTGTVDYSADGVYTFEMTAVDSAGNAAVPDYSGGGVNTNPQSFTIDRTPPKISLVFDHNEPRNGKYFNAPRTAILTIEEHNFRESGAQIRIFSSGNGEGTEGPVFGPWRTEGNRWIAETVFGADGDYAVRIAYTDPAGNSAEPVSTEEFTVDTTPPAVTITGVSDSAAYRAGITPEVRFFDENFTPALCSIKWTVTGMKGTRIINAAEAGTVSDAENSRTVVLPDPELLPGNDGIWRLSASVMDLAGNIYSTDEIRYSVNRFGSVYDADDFPETRELIGQSIGSAPVIRIRETNPDRLESFSVKLSVNGTIRELKEGTEFSVESYTEETAWKQYIYTVFENAFLDENGKLRQGGYTLTVSSADQAGNLNSNRMDSHTDSPVLSFTLDNTAPSGYISAAGLAERGKRIRASQTDVTVYWEDNTGMAQVDIYMNGNLVTVLSGDELDFSSGSYVLRAEESDRTQSVYAVLTDRTGNRTKLDVLEFYLNSSSVGQFLNSPYALAVLIAAVGTSAALAFFIRKRIQR